MDLKHFHELISCFHLWHHLTCTLLSRVGETVAASFPVDVVKQFSFLLLGAQSWLRVRCSQEEAYPAR